MSQLEQNQLTPSLLAASQFKVLENYARTTAVHRIFAPNHHMCMCFALEAFT